MGTSYCTNICVTLCVCGTSLFYFGGWGAGLLLFNDMVHSMFHILLVLGDFKKKKIGTFRTVRGTCCTLYVGHGVPHTSMMSRVHLWVSHVHF